MLINQLPDDCLLIIFNFFTDWKTLNNFSRVCFRWHQLIRQRLSRMKFALKSNEIEFPESTVLLESNLNVEDVETFLPKLKVLFLDESNINSDLVTFAQNNESIIGLILDCFIFDQRFVQRFQNLEILVTNRLGQYLEDREFSMKLKQLHYESDCSHTISEKFFNNFGNLERLHIEDYLWGTQICNNLKMDNLKILEMSPICIGNFDYFIGFRFMDFFPALQSAHFRAITSNCLLDASIKHETLRDLVLDYETYDSHLVLDQIEVLLSKFPNLENLAIRGSEAIADRDIDRILKLVPKIKLMDFRGSPKVTSRSIFYLRRQCLKSVTIYHNCEGDEPEDWPKVIAYETQLVVGLDFMTNCFYRKFEYLPKILYPY